VLLEAFAKYLHSADPATPANSILARWLWERLTAPTETLIDRVLRAEIKLDVYDKNSSSPQVRGFRISSLPGYILTPTSESGRMVIRSLLAYASCYEQQKWSRWVHCVKASDFNQVSNGG
jgi:hypothetical protein